MKRAAGKAPIRSAKTKGLRTALIAPCGMNCGLCRAYLREKNACPGCRGDDSAKPKTRTTCRIKTCPELLQGKLTHCSGCDRFPCDKLHHLDERYRTKYGMSMIGNLEQIKKSGIRHFVRSEKERWACPGCGQQLCVHEPQCLFCGRTRRHLADPDQARAKGGRRCS
jgi:hypothetical protein